MLLLLLAYLGGVLTILSPCILPVLPLVFARSGQPFVRGTVPLLAGMAVTFAAVGTLAALGGSWAVHANQFGRIAAMVLLTGFAATLLFQAPADRLTRPFVTLGNRLSQSSDSAQRSGTRIGWSFVLGIAVGMLWTPCAGPILGLVLTGAALQGASANTTLLLLAYALGAATSLAVALFAGGRVFATMTRSLGASEWIRRGLGVAVLLGVVAIAFGLDTKVLTKWSLGNTTKIEQSLLDLRKPKDGKTASDLVGGTLPVEGEMPALAGATLWLNSPPLVSDSLRGKVVLVDFWTYSCINCLRALPYVRAWADKYRDHGLVVIGVHAPEFAFEKDSVNVRRAVHDLHVGYPVALDNDYSIWRAFKNEYWPAHYFIDSQGHIRHHHFGEGEYAASERIIQTLLREAGYQNVPSDIATPAGEGAEAAAGPSAQLSTETYLGYGRAERFASGNMVRDTAHNYANPGALSLNQWSLTGSWIIGEEESVLNRAPGRLTYRFHARDLHLVVGPSADHKPVRFRVTIDGKAPGDSHGTDADADGNGIVTEQRLYQLIRQHGDVTDHTFEIEFRDPGVTVFTFTFG